MYNIRRVLGIIKECTIVIEKIFLKYKSMNRQLKLVFWFTFIGVLQKGISVITTPIFTRVLSTEDYGIFSVFNAYYVVLAIIITLNLDLSVLNNAFIKMGAAKEKIVSSFQSLALVLSGICFVGAVVFREQLSAVMGLPVVVVVFMFLGLVFREPYAIWIAYKRYQYDYKKAAAVTITVSFMTPLASFLAIFFTTGNQGVARVIAFVCANGIVPGFLFYFVNYKKDKTFYDRTLWTYALGFSVPLVAHYLSESLLNQTDRIMINAYSGTGDAAVYSVAYSAASLFSIFATSLNTAFVPWQYQKLKEKEYKMLGKVASIVFVIVALLLFMLILFAPEVVAVLAGPKYVGAVYLIPTLSASVFFGFVYQVFGRVELYYEKKAYVVVGTVTATILNIVLNMWWIPQFGYYAAGYSTLISHIVLLVMHVFFYEKVVKDYMEGEKVYNIRNCVIISGCVLAAAFVTTLLYPYLLVRLLLLLVFAGIAILKRELLFSLIKMFRSK